jgi:hypothetical protein
LLIGGFVLARIFPMKLWRLIPCVALVIAAGPAPAAAQQERLGRMFFTPAQRASLDIARSQRARTTVATENIEQEVAPAAQTITYGGAIRRSDGRTTVWLNNRPVHDTDPASSSAIVSRVRPDGSIRLQAPQSGRSVDLKPGQSVELLTGTIEESYSRRPLSQPASGAKPAPKPGPRPTADAITGKPAPADVAKAEQAREERQQQVIEDAVSRAVAETAAARPGAPEPAPQPAAPPPMLQTFPRR